MRRLTGTTLVQPHPQPLPSRSRPDREAGVEGRSGGRSFAITNGIDVARLHDHAPRHHAAYPGRKRHRFFSDALLESGLVPRPRMSAALEESRRGGSYSEILVLGGAVSEDALSRVRANHHGLDHVDLDVFGVDAVAAALMPEETARRLTALPIGVLPSGEVAVAMHDPERLMNTAELQQILGRPVRLMVATLSQIESRLREVSEAPAGTLAGFAAAANDALAQVTRARSEARPVAASGRRSSSSPPGGPADAASGACCAAGSVLSGPGTPGRVATADSRSPATP